jgi:hypothetical protein
MKAIIPVKLTKLASINCDWGSTDRKSSDRNYFVKEIEKILQKYSRDQTIFAKKIQEIEG